MIWRFWEPKHKFVDAVPQLLAGLADGTYAFAEPFADEEPEEGVVLQLDVPANVPMDKLMNMVVELAAAADRDHRANGGHGLDLAKIDFQQQRPAKQAAVALAPVNADDPPEPSEAVAKHLREQPTRQLDNYTMRITSVEARTHTVATTA